MRPIRGGDLPIRQSGTKHIILARWNGSGTAQWAPPCLFGRGCDVGIKGSLTSSRLAAGKRESRLHSRPSTPASANRRCRPAGQPADAAASGDLGDVQPVGRAQDDPRPRHVLLGARLRSATIGSKRARSAAESKDRRSEPWGAASHTRWPLVYPLLASMHETHAYALIDACPVETAGRSTRCGTIALAARP